MHRLLREPLLHFLVLGAVLFGINGWLNRGAFESSKEIVVSRGHIDSLRAQFERVWQRPPSSSELQGLVDNWVREEIFYREGLAMGLDRDDPIVRRRISQKVQFIIESARPTVPTTEELQDWLDTHADAYRAEPGYSLTQVYFDPMRHGERLTSVLARARSALERGEPFEGDPTMLPPTFDGAAPEVERIFGAEFERQLLSMPTESWQGPVRSGFGVHLVALHRREEGRAARLDEVRAAVERDLLHARSEESAAALYDRLRAGYAVRIDDASPAAEPAG